MALLELLSYTAVVGILVCYFKGGKAFDWANVLGFIPLSINAYMHTNIPSSLISLSFGLIAIWRLYVSRTS